MSPKPTLRNNLEAVQTTIAEAARRAGRDPASVKLVAVTKRRGPELVRGLYELGVRDFGENYPQELWEKVAALSDLTDARWHLIGHLQGNKVARTVPMTRVIHGVDSFKLLRSLDDLSATMPNPPEVCLQVNVAGEFSKHGWTPSSLYANANELLPRKSVRLVGLMTMAPLGTDAESARPYFATLCRMAKSLGEQIHHPLPELSMGMSGDFVSAIEEGATMVRIGSALFEGLES